MATAHLWVYGIIGESPADSKDKYYSFNDFRKELDPKATDYTVHIMSPGGDVFQGQAIYNGLINTGKSIKVLVEGVCASIATLIAGAADPGKLFINKNSQWMVHPPKFSNISGDSEQLRTGAEQLDQIQTLLINVYQKRTKLSEDKLKEIIDNTTWMLPEEAKSYGFVDEVLESLKAVAYADFKNIIMEDKSTILDKPTFLSGIENLGNRIANSIATLLNGKIKNMTDTLADGTVIQVDAEDGEWVGKKVSYQDGAPLPVGDYVLASGATLVVGENSIIAEVKAAEAATDKKPEDMELKAKLEAAEAALVARDNKIKELESALTARNDVAAKAEAKVKTFESKYVTELKQVQDELAKIKNTTVGDTTPVDLGVKKGFDPSAPVVNDPMTAFFKQSILSKRNTD